MKLAKKSFALAAGVAIAATLLGPVAPALAAEGHIHDELTAGSAIGTGSGMIYNDAVDSRTFDGYQGEWSTKRSNSVCAAFVLCASADGYWQFNGDNGMLRVQTNGGSTPSGNITHNWTSPVFRYAGHEGNLPQDNVVQYRLRATTEDFAAGELSNGAFKVQVVDTETGAVVAQNTGKELIPEKNWKMKSFSIGGSKLTLGKTYQLRAVTTIAKKAWKMTGGSVDWDCVSVTAKNAPMTGLEGCGAYDAPPKAGEWMNGGGSSPVCWSPIDPLMGPLLATLDQIFVTPVQLADGIGHTTADVVNALLDPARPLSKAIGDLTGTFAATTTGLTGPMGEMSKQLQPFTEAIAGALVPGSKILSAFVQPIANVIGEVSGWVTGPTFELVSTILSPVGALTAPLIPVYNSLVRPITEPIVSSIMTASAPALTSALGPNGVELMGSLLVPMNAAATGLIGPFTATLGTLHPVHGTITNLLDPIFQTAMTAMGPDGVKYMDFTRAAYSHSYPECGDTPATAPSGNGSTDNS